jgi:hypothetical protein
MKRVTLSDIMANHCYAQSVSPMLSVTYKSFMLSVVMLHVVMLCVIMLSVIMLSVIIPSVETLSQSCNAQHYGKELLL